MGGAARISLSKIHFQIPLKLTARFENQWLQENNSFWTGVCSGASCLFQGLYRPSLPNILSVGFKSHKLYPKGSKPHSTQGMTGRFWKTRHFWRMKKCPSFVGKHEVSLALRGQVRCMENMLETCCNTPPINTQRSKFALTLFSKPGKFTFKAMLVGGFNPSEKYARQIGFIFPK